MLLEVIACFLDVNMLIFPLETGAAEQKEKVILDADTGEYSMTILLC